MRVMLDSLDKGSQECRCVLLLTDFEVEANLFPTQFEVGSEQLLTLSEGGSE